MTFEMGHFDLVELEETRKRSSLIQNTVEE